MEQRIIDVNGVKLANNLPFGLLCGPCQIESRQHAIDIAGAMVEITKELNIPYIFKASFDKANRTSIHGARGVGLEEGMRTFDEIKKLYNNLPIVTDVHENGQGCQYQERAVSGAVGSEKSGGQVRRIGKP